MASNAPGQCCIEGVKHEGATKGSMIKVRGFDAYIVAPTGSIVHKNTAILYLPDYYSIYTNAQLIADQFAANGYYTIVPDVFCGDDFGKTPKGPDFALVPWLQSKHAPKDVEPVVDAALQHLAEEGYTKIGSVGYCFGAKYTIRYLAKGRGVSVGYVAHPSFVDEDELRAITGPLSITAAETDEIFPSEKRQKSEKILREIKVPFQINLYSGVSHGFSVRPDLSVRIEKFSKEAAFFQAVQWFNEYLV